MFPSRRLIPAAIVPVALLTHSASAFALAGSGSSHFGGGGGFGGGGFRGGGGLGHGFGIGAGYGFARHAGGIAVAILGLLVLIVLIAAIGLLLAGMRARAVRRQRVRQVELAALEAAENDREFASDRVRSETESIFRGIEQAWSADDRAGLAQLVGPDLMVEWNRRLDDFARRGWHNQVTILGAPQIEYVGLVNRAEERDDRVVIRLSARMRDVVVDSWGRQVLRRGSVSDVTSMCEYWTLGKRAGKWMLLSIEQEREGQHELFEEIIPAPWADTGRLHEAAVVEQATTDKPPQGYSVADIAPAQFSGEARAAALDLALVDGRFAPDVLGAEVRRAVQAWAEAVDGSDAELRTLASSEAVRDLLHPGDPSARTRLVVRGPHVRALRIVGLDARATPPTMTVELSVHGRRYLEDRDTAAVMAGSQGNATAFTERWTLALDGDDAHPWRIVNAASPASV
jgi:predicted lipid-binding transport protein (Tim44 family)